MIPIADPTGSEAAARDHSACGLREAAAIIRGLGGSPTGLDVVDGANGQQIADGVNRLGRGLTAAVLWGDPYTLARSVLPDGGGLVVGVWCTPNAEPCARPQATANHWLAMYGAGGECFNCWEQTFPKYLGLSYQHNPAMSAVLIRRSGPAPATVVKPAAPSSPPATVGDDMGASFVTADGSTQARFWIAGGQVWEMWYAQGAWHGPLPVPFTVGAAGGLSASCTADGATQLVFWQGIDGHQHEVWYAGGGWHGPVTIA